jgi:DNA-binding beta-propeller fold protein YncE
MLTGGAGSRPAQFAGPRGIAVDPAGEEVLIADTGNDRIQWFTLDGTFVRAFGATGQGPGQFDEPNGVAVDSRGHLFVTDAANHRLQEFDAHQALVREWRGPDPGFYGPRDIAVGLDGTLFIVDQGRGRVVKLGIDGSSSAFGSLGSGPGQLRDPTGLAVSEDRVYVADSANGRIVVFSPAGAFVRSQLIPEWQKTLFQFPDVTLGPNRDVLYASSPATNEIIVLDLELNRLGTLKSPPGERFEGPSAMALRPSGGLYVIEYGANRVSLLTSLQP